METISCLFHRRATALPLAAKVTSTKRLTETAWQPTAHAAVRLGPDSPLEPTSRAQSKKEMRALVPCPALTLPSSALAEAGHRASPHGHIVSDASLLGRLGGGGGPKGTAKPIQLPVRLGTARAEENGQGPVTPKRTTSGSSGASQVPAAAQRKLSRPALMTVCVCLFCFVLKIRLAQTCSLGWHYRFAQGTGMCIHTCVEVRTTSTSFSGTTHFSFWDKVSQWPGTHQVS